MSAMLYFIPPIAIIKAFLGSKKFLIPAGIVLLLLAIGGGTYLYLNHQTKALVTAAVKQADSTATVKTLETKAKITERSAAVDVRMDKLHTQTTKDYENVRSHIESAPVESKSAAVPALIIDTINELDRLRSVREAADADRTGDNPIPK